MIKVVLAVQKHGNHNVIRLYRQGARRTKQLACKVLASSEENDIMLTHWVDTLTQMGKDIVAKSNRKWVFVEKNDFNTN